MNTEERLIDIEIKLSRQEDLVETLNRMVYQQQQEIDKLASLCKALARHITQMQGDGGAQAGGHEPPPHY